MLIVCVFCGTALSDKAQIGKILFFLGLTLFSMSAAAAENYDLLEKDLFVSGTENTHTFRIPALITAPNGDLIACCDARRKSAADLIWVRDIDIVIKRS